MSISIMLATLLSFLSFMSSTGAQGEAAWDSEAYRQAVEGRFPIASKITFGQFPPPRLEVTWDPVFEGAWAEIKQANGFDMVEAANLMPDAFYYSRWQTQLFPWLYNGLSDRWVDKSMKYHELDDTARKTLYRVAGVMVKMPTKMHFAAESVEGDPNDYEFVAYLSYLDGSTHYAKTGTTYNTKTGRLGADKGFGNLGFNYFVNDNLLEGTKGSWQRKLGYTKIYDTLLLQAGKMTDIDTLRVKFSHDKKDWLFQLWKGRYLNMPGGEIGLYNKPAKRRGGFYNTLSDNELVGLSYKLTDKRNGKLLADRPLDLHWWTAGFAIYNEPLNGKNLTLETVIAPQDDALLESMKAALDKKAAAGQLAYETLDTKFGPAVRITW